MPAVPGTRLEDDGGDRRRALERDHLLEMLERPLALLLLGRRVERRPVEERAEEVRDAGAAVVVRPAAGSPVRLIDVVRAAVVRAVRREAP